MLETTRALSFQANRPSKFWGDSILCATYLINRLPLACLNNISPYEKLFRQPPQTNHLRAYQFQDLSHSPFSLLLSFGPYPTSYFISDPLLVPPHAPVPPMSAPYSSSQPLISSDPSSSIPCTSPSPSSQPTTPLPLRKSTRPHKLPSLLKDYVCHTFTSHWCNIVQFTSLPAHHQAFIASHFVWRELSSYKEVVLSKAWQSAMQAEIQALENNNTWDLVPLPPRKKAIGFPWVYKVKLKADGALEHFKARLVAKGYSQQYGVDFHETFSPVIKMTTVRCIIALAASK